MPQQKILIIGAGLSGLSAAALLAHGGFDVTVLEKNGQPGGVAGVYENAGFRFDTGPSWYLMPEVFNHFFARFNKRPNDFFDLIRLNPYYKVFFSRDDMVEITPDMNQNYQLFDSLEQDGGKKLKQYLELARYKYNIAMDQFLYRDYTSLLDFFNRKLVFEGTKLHVFQKLDRFVKRYFTSDRARKLLEYNMVFLGCSPFKSPALYSIMSHVDMSLGVHYPQGGIHEVARALEKLACELGADIKYNLPAVKIDVSGRRSTNVYTDNGTYNSDIVLVASDYHHAETTLLDPPYQTYPEKYWDKKLLAPSAFIVYLGLNKKLPNLQHHNLYLSDTWEEHFNAIFDSPTWPEKPSYYVACPSKTDLSVAPEGGENIFLLVPVAPGIDDSDEIREHFFNTILAHFEHLTGISIADAIVVKRFFSQRDFAAYLNMYQGTAMGMAHTLWQTAYFRPSHKSKKVENLYYTGHYTHPGIGLPMVLIASQIVCDIIKKEHT
jgi:phytoene desaturase